MASHIDVGLAELQSGRSLVHDYRANPLVEPDIGQKRGADIGMADEDFSPVQDDLVSFDLCLCSEFGYRGSRLGLRDSDADFSSVAAKSGKVVALDILRADLRNNSRRPRHRQSKGCVRADPANLLQNQQLFQKGEPATAVLLGQTDAEKASLSK